jgi:hypothetical protein
MLRMLTHSSTLLLTSIFVLGVSACSSEEESAISGGPAGSTGSPAGSGGGASSSTAGASGGAGGQGGGGPTACKADLECPCGQVCALGTCAASDCSINNCPGADKGRVCSCDGGILDVDGKTGAQWPGSDVVLRRRPIVVADDNTNLVLRNYHVYDVTNMKAVHVTTCSAEGWKYNSVTLSCLEVNNVIRDDAGAQAGLHMDYIKIDGCGTEPATALLEDINVHDGNVYSLISDVRLTSLTLRRVKHENTQGAFQLGTLSQPDIPDAGYIDEIHIDQSPGLHVALLGTKIGRVYVTASPGVTGTAANIPVIFDEVSCPSEPLSPNQCCLSATETCM